MAGLALPVAAKDKKPLPEWRSWPNGQRLVVSAGLYKPKMNTSAIVSDSNGNLGAGISFEDTLGLDKNKSTAFFAFNWRISRRNALAVNYFKLDRSSTQESTINIWAEIPPGSGTIEDTEVTLPLSATFNIESFDITYAFSPIFTEKHNLGLGIGLAVQSLQFGFRRTEECLVPDCILFGPEPREAKSTAPLPTLKLVYSYMINDKWQFRTNLGYFALELELDSAEKIGGSIWNAEAGVRWLTWKHVGFNLGWKLFDVNIDYAKRDLRAEAEYQYSGLFLGIDAYF